MIHTAENLAHYLTHLSPLLAGRHNLCLSLRVVGLYPERPVGESPAFNQQFMLAAAARKHEIRTRAAISQPSDHTGRQGSAV